MNSTETPKQPNQSAADRTSPWPAQPAPTDQAHPAERGAGEYSSQGSATPEVDDGDWATSTPLIHPQVRRIAENVGSATKSPFPPHMRTPSNPPPRAPAELQNPFPKEMRPSRPPPSVSPFPPDSSEPEQEAGPVSDVQGTLEQAPSPSSAEPSPFPEHIRNPSNAPPSAAASPSGSNPFPSHLAAPSRPASANPEASESAAAPAKVQAELPGPAQAELPTIDVARAAEAQPAAKPDAIADPAAPGGKPVLEGQVVGALGGARTAASETPVLGSSEPAEPAVADAAHAHTNDTAPSTAQHRRSLEAGAGRGKVLFLDAFSGISGDMAIAALIDLGVPLSAVQEAVACLPLEGFRIEASQAKTGSIGATRFSVHVESPQAQRTYSTIDAMLKYSSLPDPVRELSQRIFRRLAEAEAKVHQVSVEEVHFHEVGAVDAIVDIVGVSACIAYLGADIICSPLPMGHGFVNTAHGILPLPAPATLECLKGVPTYSADLSAELVTPTGAAIIGTVAKAFTRWPNVNPLRLGWGAGSRTLPDRPNALRVVLGDAIALPGASEPTHVILQSNIDDMSGELAGHAISLLLDHGALDAWAMAVTMKKGRPGLVLSVLSDLRQADGLAAVMLRETSTLGVRRIPITRAELERHSVTVATRFGPVELKVAKAPSGPRAKPEFDVCAQLARDHSVSVQEVIAEALSAWTRSHG